MEFECQETYTEHNVVFVMKNQTDGMVIIAIRSLVPFALFGDFTAVMVFVFDLTHSSGASLTPPSRPPCSAS